MSINYTNLVKQHLDSRGEPISPSHMYRCAVEEGAIGSATKIISELRKSCENLCKGSDYRRLRTDGVKGYQYLRVNGLAISHEVEKVEKVNQGSVVILIKALNELQAKEWKSLGFEPPEPCQVIELPDGKEDIYRRLWNIFCKDKRFSNDILFTYTFPSLNGETLTSDLQALYDYCADAIVDNKVTFRVCW
jgi:prophage maintenance system killer protein